MKTTLQFREIAPLVKAWAVTAVPAISTDNAYLRLGIENADQDAIPYLKSLMDSNNEILSLVDQIEFVESVLDVTDLELEVDLGVFQALQRASEYTVAEIAARWNETLGVDVQPSELSQSEEDEDIDLDDGSETTRWVN